MADKFKSTFPIAINFVDGELPTAAKFSGLAKQAKNSARLLETAVGDIWNQAGDPLLTSTSLSENSVAIANIARLLGKSDLLSPTIPSLSTIQKYFYKVTSDDVTSGYELTLTFPVKTASTSFTWTGTGAPISRKSDPASVSGSNDWYVNFETGKVIFYDAIHSSWVLEYEPEVDGDIDANATFNVIPDPDTDVAYGFQGLKIEYLNLTNNSQGYKVYLPPRGPLNTKHTTRSPQKDTVAPNNTQNFQTNPSGGNRLFWQDDSAAADTSSNAEHYRYLLPKIITGAAGWAKSITIPAGLVYLYDPINTGTIIDGVTLFADDQLVPRKYVLIAKGTNLDVWLSSYGSTIYTTAILQSSSHAVANYPATGLRLMTVGSAISQVVLSLLKQFLNHDHASQNSLPSKPVPHGSLAELFNPLQGSIAPKLVQPDWTNDHHPQYLHRYGTQGEAERDPYHNGMLGDLFLTSTDSFENYTNEDNISRNIIFGSISSGARIRYDSNYLKIIVPSGSTVNALHYSDLATSGTVELGITKTTSGNFTAGNSNLLSAKRLLISTVANTIALDPASGQVDINGGLAIWHSSSSGLFSSYIALAQYVSGSIESGYVADNADSCIIQNLDGGLAIKQANNLFPGSSSIYATRMRSGPHSDGTYGYSNATPASGYGPIRRHYVPLTDFVEWTTSSISEGESITPAHPLYKLNEIETSTSISAHVFPYLKVVAAAPPGRSAVHATINLPYLIYHIVNVELSVNASDTGLNSDDDFYIRLGYLLKLPANSTSNEGVLAAFKDLHILFGTLTGDNVWYNDVCFPVSTTTPLVSISNEAGTSSTQILPFIQIVGQDNSAFGDILSIGKVCILYRIQEF